MLITIKNIIGSIRNVLGIVTDGLNMWLPFERSDILGANVVVNGDFAIASGTGLGWTATGGATTTGGVGFLASSPASSLVQNNLVPGKTYYFSIEAKTDSSGNIKISNNGVKFFTNSSLSSSFTTFTGYFTANANDLTIGETGVGGIYIDNVSVKEVTQFAPDTSGNLNNATLYAGKALSFDGVNDYVDCGNIGVSLKTLAFWVNLDSTTEKVLQVTSSQSVEVLSGTITLNGAWTGSTIYVDATATSTIAASSYKRVVITTTSAITVDDLELGRIGSSYGDFILSDLEIYDTPWTQADVTYDYNKPNHLVTDNPSTSTALSNLKGYWALSEGDGAIAYDSSGEDNDGTINGATYVDKQPTIPQLGMMDWAKSTPVSDEITLIANPNNPSQDILGNSVRLREHSFNLDGSGYAEVADDSSLDIANYSIDGWFYSTNNSSNYEAILTKLTQDNFEVYIRNSQLRYFNSTDSEKLLSAITLNVWTYFCITESGGTLKCYINDDSTPKSSQTVTARFANSGNVYIGSHQSGDYSNALIDDIRVYNRVLSADEVLQNYKAGLNQHKIGSSFSDDFSGDYGN